MNLQMIMQQAQKMQKELAKKMEQFEVNEFEYGYQNNSVIVKINGAMKILSVKIIDELVDPEDKQTLEEMIAEATTHAIQEVKKQKDSLMPKAGGMPGLF